MTGEAAPTSMLVAKEDTTATDPAAPIPVELLAGRMVTIRVGSLPTTFTVHEKILKTGADSRFFQVAFNNGFKETGTGTLELPEDDPQAFRVLLHWIYGTTTGFLNCEKKMFFHELDTSTIIKLYVLAAKYMMTSLHDAIITHLWWHYTQATCCLQVGFTQDAMAYFEANTMAGCHLDKLLVDWMTDDTLSSKPSKLAGDYYSGFDCMPHRLIRAAFINVNRVLPEQGNYYNAVYYHPNRQGQKGELCSYHCHGDDQPCAAPRYAEKEEPTY